MDGDRDGLRLSGLAVSASGVPVLRGVDLHVPAGRLVALLGPNGSGRTTLLRTVSGLLAPDSGTISLDGVALPADPQQVARRGVAHVAQGRRVFRRLTVAENLRMGAWPSTRPDPDRLARVLDLLPALAERPDVRAGELSGGQQQMLVLGRALVSGPVVLLADEPATGLAPSVVTQVMAALRALADTGCAVLLVEHDTAAALSVADDAVVLVRGEVALREAPVTLTADRLARAYLG